MLFSSPEAEALRKRETLLLKRALQSVKSVYMRSGAGVGARDRVQDWNSGDLHSVPSSAMRLSAYPLPSSVCLVYLDVKRFRAGTISYYVFVWDLAEEDPDLNWGCSVLS